MYAGSLELKQLLPPIKGERGFDVAFEVLAGLDHGGLGTQQLIEVFALDVLAGDQIVDGDAK